MGLVIFGELGALFSFLHLLGQGKGLTPTFSNLHNHQLICTIQWFSKTGYMHQHTTPWGHATLLTLEPLAFFTQAAMQLPNLVLVSFPWFNE